MRRLLALLGLLLLCGPALAQRAILFDGGRDDEARALATDATGAQYVAGSSAGAQPAAGFVVVKHDVAGALRWVARYVGPGQDDGGAALAVALDAAGNVYAAGYLARQIDFLTVNYDWLVVSFDANGAQRWSHVFNGAGNGADMARQLMLDTAGGLYATGLVSRGPSLKPRSVPPHSAAGFGSQVERTPVGTASPA